MAYHFDFAHTDLTRCRFALSPLWETQEAVRTLHRPARHGRHLPWLRRIRADVEQLDLRPLWLLMPERGYTPTFLGPPPLGPDVPFSEEIAALRATDPRSARVELAQALACTPGAADSPTGRALLTQPAQAVRDLADLLEAVWHLLIEPYWPRLRTLLEADILFHTRRLAQGGLEALFSELHPRLTWAPPTLTLTTRAGWEERRPLDGQGLVLVPSLFCWPDLVSGMEAPWQPALVYPARGIGSLWTPETTADHVAPTPLARLLGRNRATVLHTLTEPASTSALALRLGLAPSSVSDHLSALRDAGLLVSRRYGHQVLYERTPLGIALASGTGS
ncbi:ArsR/SmtB family transcription factor [Streptomyces finlayi]|uniref:ArsR/SmtB family transcription factor n=1 Tax=Streptomyces finlayi TaxID=67296 RepID=UPI00167826B3|nr:DUF5937 family protein [Streptomyces finlayi]